MAYCPHDPVDTAAKIEADYQRALAVIKQQRPFALDPWSQKLPGAGEQRVAGQIGGTMRDRGQRLEVQS